ncbi:DUF4430 domain-containing protein [Intestinibacter sp.]
MKKKILSVLISIILCIGLVGCNKNQGDSTVKVTIIGPNKQDYILQDYEIKVAEGTTALEGLQIATKENKIQMEFTGSQKTAYVRGINNLYEFDKGAESGWLYRVNDVFPDKSAGATGLSDGDELYWLYTQDLGRDWRSPMAGE